MSALENIANHVRNWSGGTDICTALATLNRGTLKEGNWFHITYEQLMDWGCLFHELRMNKPVFDIFIDDKVINSQHYFGVMERE